ncbi:MAG: NADH:flavin oxidoreductase/NADH oxidase [Deltaproteobacteria bacterium]|nr:NADH:flavin oxidoreductase/NADH oxidase [Deltaproteobacteria bacterium]
MSMLFSPFRLREIEFKNRVFLSPMCQYSSVDGLPNDWHFVHLGSRISPWDSGIWSDRHPPAFKRITAFIQEQGSVPGIQLGHAGRKASTEAPWRGEKSLGKDEGGWQPLAPSPLPFKETYPVPREMSSGDLREVVSQFAAGARRSLEAGFKVIEIHMAHGYLLHEFLSPLSNQRNDEYGGPLENRVRFPLEVARAVRENWPGDLPLFVRISCTDWVDGGWDLPQSIELSRRLKEIGVDLIDCSSGGLVPYAKIPLAPGYQAPFAAEIRSQVGIATGAVGLITEPGQAEQILTKGQADAVIMGRELLRNPYWPLHAAKTLSADVPWPPQYLRVKPK